MRNSENEGGGAWPALGPYLPLLVTLILLAPLQSAAAGAQIESGSTQQLGNTFLNGSTSYVIYYTYPSEASVGSNLTISLTLHVGSFSGVIENIVGYGFQVQLYVGELQQSVTINGPGGFNASSFLYPGGIWGPVNATFPLTAANTGLGVGQSANATFSVTLRDTAYAGEPYLKFVPEPAMQGQGGTLMIQNAVATSSTSSSATGTSGSGQTLLPYALLASGAVLIAAAVFMPRGPRPQTSNQK